MKKYHIKKDGTVGKCTATVGTCPLGEHFDTQEKAQRYSEKHLQEEYSEESLEEKEQRWKRNKEKYINTLHPLLFKRDTPSSFLEKLSVERRINKFISILEGAKNENINEAWKNADKSKWKNKSDFKEWYQRNNPYYKDAQKRFEAYRNEVAIIIQQRLQAVELFKKIDHLIIDKSFSSSSSKSASSYIIVNGRDVDDVMSHFKSKGFNAEIRKEFLKDEDIIIRMADHDNKNTDEHILVDFKSVKKNVSQKDLFKLIERLKKC